MIKVKNILDSTGMTEGSLATSLGISIQCLQKYDRIVRLTEVVELLNQLDHTLTPKHINQILNTDVKLTDEEEAYSLITSINLGIGLSHLKAYEIWQKEKRREVLDELVVEAQELGLYDD